MQTQLFFLILLVGGSSFFSASEISLFGITNSKLKVMMENKNKNVDIIAKLLSSRERLLAVILLGNNIVNISAASLATAFFAQLLKPVNMDNYGPILATVVMTIVILVFGAVLPKTMASQNPEKVAQFIAKPLYLIYKVLSPIAQPLNKFVTRITTKAHDEEEEKKVVNLVTKEELQAMADISLETGGVNKEQNEFIKGVLNLSSLKVKDVMTHKMDLCYIDETSTIEHIRCYMDKGYSHLPVCASDNKQKIIGILHVRNIAYIDRVEDINILEIMSEPFFISNTMIVENLLSVFKENHRQVAVVTDEFGEVAGIVTIEDVLEEIVGDIADEYDVKEEKTFAIDDGKTVVFGNMKLSEFNKQFQTKYQSQHSTTIGGFIQEQIPTIPYINETIEIDDYVLKIIGVENNCVMKVEVSQVDEVEEEKIS
ncbi:HlyC/CorC family transporter [Vallitalea pronyensis]|uniref:HlyC/CorC family transporter n=1 Tax=Vallitalea pronyensis TaxID=1348613 RepID=A0A8J8MLX6_9FIRM|nr:hemolysin family protein [Vallitalea pronyensis]QUI23949.1 HlyC/CorC family transporter [Vallitalea pronyensis]